MTEASGNINNISGTSGSTESATSAHGLQALIELSYAQVANQVLVGNLASLSSAMGITTNVITQLTTLQNLKNDVSINNPATLASQFNIDGTNFSSPSNFESTFSKTASALFGNPVTVSANWGAQSTTYTSVNTAGQTVTHTIAGSTNFKAQLSAVYAQLTAELPLLSAITPVSGQANSLYAGVKQILADLKTSGAINGSGQVVLGDQNSGAIKYIEDNYNSTGGVGGASAGAWEQDITTALTAGQSLNTTQTETVRNFLYLFQEYYTSASQILTQMTQIMQTMAQNAGH